MIERQPVQLSQEELLKKNTEKIIERFKPRVLAYPIIGALANLGYAQVSEYENVSTNPEQYLGWGAAMGIAFLAYRTIRDLRALENGNLLTRKEEETK